MGSLSRYPSRPHVLPVHGLLFGVAWRSLLLHCNPNPKPLTLHPNLVMRGPKTDSAALNGTEVSWNHAIKRGFPKIRGTLVWGP